MSTSPKEQGGWALLAAAGVLFRDERGRLLVVRLPYDAKHPVAVPGGGWEPQDLSPRRTAVREVAEELGFTPRLGALACIDWSLDEHRPPIAAHLYWAAEPLTPERLAALRPAAEEVGGWAALTVEQAGHALPPKLSRRAGACLRTPPAAGPLELEDSFPVGHTREHVPVRPAPEYTGLAGVALNGDPGGRRAREPLLDRAAYYAALPRIRAKCRAVFTDARGRVLLVRPVPRAAGGTEWILPGGSIEADREVPRAAMRRESREELGWDREPGRLLALDWQPAPGDGGPGLPVLVYVFDGGTVTDGQLAAIRLPEGELLEWRLCAPDEARVLLSDTDRARTEAALANRRRPGGPVELVRGRPAT